MIPRFTQASHELVDCPAIAGGVSVRFGSAVPRLRSWCQVRIGSPCSRAPPKYESCWEFLRKSLPEWYRGALGGQLPPGPTRSRDRPKWTASETISPWVHFLPPRRSHASWTREGNTRRQNSLPTFRSHMVTIAIGRVAPSLRLGCLTWFQQRAATVGSFHP